MTESMGYFSKTPLTASRLVKSTFSIGTDFPTMASIRRTASVDELCKLSRITTLYPDSMISTVWQCQSLITREVILQCVNLYILFLRSKERIFRFLLRQTCFKLCKLDLIVEI